MTIFTPRPSAVERREQILEATLRLLASTPIEGLTTRQLAAELSLTQPALFRHFPSREALFVAVVAHARGDLERLAERILIAPAPAIALLRALGSALLEHVERYPGLPQLLFASATPSAGPVRAAVRHLVGMQAALSAELVRQGQREGAIRRGIDAEVAATLFTGMVQGLVLRWEIAGRSEPLAPRFPPMFDLWLGGVSTSAPEASPEPADLDPPAPRVEPTGALDVRPLIARGVDPLRAILVTISGMPRAGVLLIEAPFRPTPLLALLARHGHRAAAGQLGTDHWLVEVVVGGAPEIEDLCDLEPPEPLERILTAATALAPGAVYLARAPRFPRMLVPHLAGRGLTFSIVERPDGAAIVRLERPA